MVKTLAFIGIGHLAEYMIDGLQKSGTSDIILLVPRNPVRANKLADKYSNIKVISSAQDAVKIADIIIIATKPDDIINILEPLKFNDKQTVISVAAGISIKKLQNASKPAKAVRSLPLSNVAINKSPTIIYPENIVANAFFKQLGQVYTLNKEEDFPASSALTGAFYAWLFALMFEISKWSNDANLPPDLSRNLIQDTMESAAAMARNQSETSLDIIWDSLATSGGISEQGHKVIQDNGGFDAFNLALEAVFQRLNKQQNNNNKSKCDNHD